MAQWLSLCFDSFFCLSTLSRLHHLCVFDSLLGNLPLSVNSWPGSRAQTHLIIVKLPGNQIPVFFHALSGWWRHREHCRSIWVIRLGQIGPDWPRLADQIKSARERVTRFEEMWKKFRVVFRELTIGRRILKRLFALIMIRVCSALFAKVLQCITILRRSKRSNPKS